MHYTAAHWGIYEVKEADGRPRLRGFARDPDPSPIGLFQADEALTRLRIRRPAIRRSWLEHGPGARTEKRGEGPFVEVDWDTATRLVADELARVRASHGNSAIFGGSYGWASAGRFHHAQSQVHRFLNLIGGYVRSVDSYSLGAAHVVMPHIVASMAEMIETHSSWEVMAEHTKLFVTFGGVPAKNAQVSSGGAGDHRVRQGLRRMAEAGVRFVNIGPVRDNLETGGPVEWIPIRPNTDTALMLALAHVIYTDNRFDRTFLDRNCVGFDQFASYLTGVYDGTLKDPAWAEGITGVPAARMTALAREMAGVRTMLNVSWSMQRASHGEQPYWMVVTLASMLGQIGLPGGGFGVGYGAMNTMGSAHARFAGAHVPQGANAVRDFIPVARIADMLLNPGATFTYNGASYAYPDIRLIYWAGGNPYHHHQDLNRLQRAWRKPDTIVVHDQFWTATARRADIVLPATTTLERNDISFANREGYIVAMRQAAKKFSESRDDFAIFAGIAERLGVGGAFTDGLDEMGWIRKLYDASANQARHAGMDMPDFDTFWQEGLIDLSAHDRPFSMLEAFRESPETHKLKTPSGRIEIFSARVASFGLPDCPGHAVWREPFEWLGAPEAARFPLHLVSDQPQRRLHSQLDHSPHSTAGKIAGREPVYLNPADAAARGIVPGDIVELFNDRGRCLAGAVVTDDIMQGVVRLATGAWFSPANGLEVHGNPNVLTPDRGASSLSQGCAAQSCLVQARKFAGELPPVLAHEPPELVTM
jgi:biotin/methionine sulfoxide reductase